jgi:hypothetical protein
VGQSQSADEERARDVSETNIKRELLQLFQVSGVLLLDL